MKTNVKRLVENIFDDDIFNDDESTETNINVSHNICPYNFIDLGLPSGTLWCDRNVGSNDIIDNGYFYQWGDTKGYRKTDKHIFNKETYKLINNDKKTFSKYNFIDNIIKLQPEDNPIELKSIPNKNVSLPTVEQFQELTDNCKFISKKVDNINGCIILSKINRQCLFIPYGNISLTHGNFLPDNVKLWSSELSDNRSDVKYSVKCLQLSNSTISDTYTHVFISDFLRYTTGNIRPVLNKN